MDIFLPKSHKTKSTTYYNYGGERLKEVRIYHNLYNVVLLEMNSSSSYNFADRYGSAIFYTAQQVFKSVNVASNIYSGAVTFIDVFTGKTLVENISTSHSTNYVMNKIIYDLTEVFEYVDMYQSGQFELGLHTNMVKSHYIETEIYMYDSDNLRGHEIKELTHQNNEFASPNYYSSPQVTIDSAYGNSNTENIKKFIIVLEIKKNF